MKELWPIEENMTEAQQLMGKLKKIEGQELKYPALCDALGITRKGGKSKMLQIENLNQYCKLEILQNPTRYVILDVYEEADAIINELNKDSYQAAFEAALYQIFLKTNCATIYASTSNLLTLFKEINHNFNYTYSDEVFKSDKYGYMSVMNDVVFEILSQWTRRKLERMHTRHVILLSRGYRLYKKNKSPTNGKEYVSTYDVPMDSEDYKTCMTIYADAIRNVLPNNWGEIVNDKIFRPYVPKDTWNAFQDELERLTLSEFDGEYFTVKEIYVIKPSQKDWVAKRLLELYQDYPSFEKINKEACSKVIKTSQMPQISGEQKREFIDINMSIYPSISLKELVENN